MTIDKNSYGAALFSDTELSSVNNMLCSFSQRWKLDGDYFRCKGCGCPQIASKIGGKYLHAEFCNLASRTDACPWVAFMTITQPLAAMAKRVQP